MRLRLKMLVDTLLAPVATICARHLHHPRPLTYDIKGNNITATGLLFAIRVSNKCMSKRNQRPMKASKICSPGEKEGRPKIGSSGWYKSKSISVRLNSVGRLLFLTAEDNQPITILCQCQDIKLRIHPAEMKCYRE